MHRGHGVKLQLSIEERWPRHSTAAAVTVRILRTSLFQVLRSQVHVFDLEVTHMLLLI